MGESSYNIPPTTLKNRILGHVKHGTKPGPQSYLTPAEGSELAGFLVYVCKMDSRKTKRGNIQGVKRLVKKKRGKENLKKRDVGSDL